MFEFLKRIFAKKEQVNVKEMLKNGALLIDVRTAREFAQGHAKKAKNIPLNKLQENIEYFKKVNKPILLCCESGMRSAQARQFLKSNNVANVYNAGTCKKFIN